MLFRSDSWSARIVRRFTRQHGGFHRNGRIRQRRIDRNWAVERLEPRELLAAQLVGHWTAASLDVPAPPDGILTDWPDTIADIPARARGAPELVTEALNGHPVVRFDATDQIDFFRVLAADSPLSGAEDFSVAVVFATTATTLQGSASQWYLNSGLVDTSSFGFVEDWGLAITQDGQVGAGIGIPPRSVYSSTRHLNDGLAHVAVLTRRGGTITLYVDGDASQRDDASLEPRAARDVKFGAGGLPFSGDLAEIRLYDGCLDSTEVESLTQNLSGHYYNEPPVARDDDYLVNEDDTLAITAEEGLLSNDSDLEEDPLVARLVSPPGHGTLDLRPDGSFVYRPEQDFFGVDQFSYVASDRLDSNVATVTIEVINQVDSPRPMPNAYLATAGQQLDVSALQGVLANDLNPDHASLVASVFSNSSHGELELRADGSFTYQPRDGFVGFDQFSYQARSGTVASSPVTVKLAVQRYPVIISEVMASNLQTRYDEDQDSSDWIELFNYGSQTVNLDGWYLTDQRDNPTRWRFPAVTLQAGEFLTVFASGKDRASQTAPWHTNFRLDAEGEFLALVEPDGRTWASVLSQGFPSQLRDVAYGLPNVGIAAGALADLTLTYLAAPTPDAANSGRSTGLGPIVTQVNHQPQPLRIDDDLVITTRILDVNDPTAHVMLHFRLMYAAEQTVPMVDDGSQGDATAGDGIYTAVLTSDTLQQAWRDTGADPESLAGKMLRYAITAEDTAGRTLRAPRLATSGGTAEQPEYFGTVFQDPGIAGELPVLSWFVPDPNWHKTATGNNTRWSSASVYFDGEFYDNLRVRVRGITTINWDKPKFKFEFNPGYAFRYADDLPRVDEFNLQSHFREKGATSYMGENLAFTFLQQIGVPAPNTFHLHVRQNGEFYSLASFVEQIDDSFLQRNGLDEYNPMYKANSPAARSTLAPRPSRADYQKVSGESESYDDLRQLTDGINNRVAGLDRSVYLFDHINLAEVINNMAGNTILTNHDRLTKNYYMYLDASGSGEWSRFPWDMDQAFAKRTGTNFSSVLYGDSEHPQATGQPVYQNHLLDAILDTPFTREMYLRRLRTLLDEYLVAGYFEDWIEEAADRITADAARDHARWRAGSLANGIARLEENLRFRREQLLADPLVPPSNKGYTSTTLIDSQAAVRVFVPTHNDDAAGWFTTGREFDDSTDAGWRVGISGVGYERGTGYERFLGDLFADEARQVPMQLLDDLDPDGDGDNLTTTVYARFRFPVDDPSVFQQLHLRMRYDDAFVAYLNGVEVARANYLGSPTWNSVSRQGNHEASEEFESFDLSFVLEAGGADLVSGENVLAVFLINAQSNSPDLLLQPELVGLNEIPPQFEIAFGAVAAGLEGDEPQEEFLELQNHGGRAVDLSGWRLEGAVQFAFPPGSALPAGGSLYVSPDVRAFRARTSGPSGGQGLFVQGPYTGRLAHANQSIRLIDNWQQLVAQRDLPADPTPLQQFLRVSELHYNPVGNDDATEFIELVNLSQGPDAVVLDLSGVSWVDGPRVPFVFPPGTQLAPARHVLVVKDEVRFRETYPQVGSAQIVGQYAGSLANGGEALQIDDSEGRVLIQFTYGDQSPWPGAADGLGYSLEVVAFQDDYNQPDTWRASRQPGGTPGRPRDVALRGDFDENGRVDAADVDRLGLQIRRASHPLSYDLTGDARVDHADLEELIERILQTRFGDANLDGRFNSSDLVAVFQRGEYEDAQAHNSGWLDGDWNGDGEFNSSDLVLAFQTGGYEREKGVGVFARQRPKEYFA